jgi:hypothetical protein
MKLVFNRKDNGEVDTFIRYSENDNRDFSYIQFIDSLYEGTLLEESDFSDEFNDDEIKSIKNMISKINEVVANFSNDEFKNNSKPSVENRKEKDTNK